MHTHTYTHIYRRVLHLGHLVGDTWKCPLLGGIRIALHLSYNFPTKEQKGDFLLGLESLSSENRHSVCCISGKLHTVVKDRELITLKSDVAADLCPCYD